MALHLQESPGCQRSHVVLVTRLCLSLQSLPYRLILLAIHLLLGGLVVLRDPWDPADPIPLEAL